MEDDLLAVWDQPAHRESALAVCSERDHMAAQWTACICEALSQIRHRTSSEFVKLTGACETFFDETFRVETAEGSFGYFLATIRRVVPEQARNEGTIHNTALNLDNGRRSGPTAKICFRAVELCLTAW